MHLSRICRDGTRGFRRTIHSWGREGVGFLARSALPLGYYIWRPAESSLPYSCNFGDELFLSIASRLLGRPIRTCGWNYPGRKVLLGGSTLNTANDHDIVWGVGSRDGRLRRGIAKLNVSAVRGRLTGDLLRSRGIRVPECYGDPAILTPMLFPEWLSVEKRCTIGIVPHYSDMHWVSQLKLPSTWAIISPVQSPENAIRQITACERIVASSLHGIICAEAFGVPVTGFRTQSDSPEPDFKYEDYFSATDRSWRPSRGIFSAVEGDCSRPPDFDRLVNGLLGACPFVRRSGE
jgi:pyruvyltransferase